METLHATCIAFDGKGVLLRGRSGSGKSDLALRAIDQGARLVADDRVVISLQRERIMASAPPALYGLLEVRGLGIARMQCDLEAEIVLIADLLSPSDGVVERLPDRRTCAMLGLELAWIALAPFEASAVAKLRLAVDAALAPGRLL